jgi:large subunit ribosomal protein L21
MAEKTIKKAVILTGGKQYLVAEGQELEVELLKTENAKSINLDALLVIDGENVSVGAPTVDGVKVGADITEQMVKADKVIAIRYKAKKRVHKRQGHRQKLSRIKITKIA